MLRPTYGRIFIRPYIHEFPPRFFHAALCCRVDGEQPNAVDSDLDKNV